MTNYRIQFKLGNLIKECEISAPSVTSAISLVFTNYPGVHLLSVESANTPSKVIQVDFKIRQVVPREL